MAIKRLPPPLWRLESYLGEGLCHDVGVYVCT